MASSARIEELRKKFEENPRRYFAPLANEYRKAGDIEQAIAICREYLPQQPGHMSGHIVYGQALFEARQVEEAKTVFETALSLDPENLIALRHLGDLALITGDSQGARTWYGRVLEADPRNEEIQAQLASLDKSPSTVPTPISTATVPEVAPPTPPPAPSKPTPSSAPTVVISAQKPQPWAAKKTPVVPPPVTAQSPTAEIRLDALPTSQSPTAEIKLDAPPPVTQEPEKPLDIALGLEPTSLAAPAQSAAAATLEIDVPVSQSHEPPPLDSFSLAGLETTSLAAAPAPSDSPAPAQPAHLAELDLGAPVAPPAEEQPLLDIGELPAAAVAAPVAAVPLPEPPPSEPFAFEESEPSPPAAAAPTPVLEEWVPPPVPSEPITAPPVPESGPFVTETMAELYLQQGHREEALRVYRALLDQRPHDRLLMAKVEALSPEAVPAAQAEAHTGPTIRELLNAIAVRRPGFRAESPRENGAVPEASAAPGRAAPDAFEAPAESAPVARGEVPEVVPTPASADALSTLFGSVTIGAADESAAAALAYAFMDLSGLENGSAGSEQINGAAARHAPNELSLDAVFRTSQAPTPAAPSSFSFDQFFSQRATSEQPIIPSGAPAASAGESREDVTQFTQWLEGLKKR